MAKRKTESIITGLGRNPDQLTVQKSRPLLDLWKSDLSLVEFKLLDMYLARIDSHKPERRVVLLEKGEVEQALGVTKISVKDLADRLIHLGQGIKIPDSTRKNGFCIIWLFEEAKCAPDEDGRWQVTLEASSKAMKYFFNIENLGYLRYKLRCVSGITSRYTYILFLYLEDNRFRKSWEVKLDELKHILNCENEEFYREFKRFNEKILKRSQKELHEKTELRFTYEPVKNGRSVVAIRFTLETLKCFEPEPEALNIDVQEPDDSNEELWVSAVKDFGFSQEQIDELCAVLITIPDFVLPQSPACYGSIALRRYHYMQIKAAEIKRRNSTKPIRNKFAYLIKIMKQDANEA